MQTPAILVVFLLVAAFWCGYGVHALRDMARQARDARKRLDRANDSRCPACGQYPPAVSTSTPPPNHPTWPEFPDPRPGRLDRVR